MPKARARQAMTGGELNALALSAPDLPREVDHLYTCPECGQSVDRRQLGDVLWHEEPGHEPIPLELGYVEPMLPTLVPTPPEGDDWLHEIKYEEQFTPGTGRVVPYSDWSRA